MSLKQVFEVDSDGFLKDIHVVEVDELGNVIEENFEGYIKIAPPHGLYRLKWSGDTWIEGETEAERAARESLQLEESLKPSLENITDAELEIKVLTILTDLEVLA